LSKNVAKKSIPSLMQGSHSNAHAEQRQQKKFIYNFSGSLNILGSRELENHAGGQKGNIPPTRHLFD
jgi:hypothetical protein